MKKKEKKEKSKTQASHQSPTAKQMSESRKNSGLPMLMQR
jgi:hypothetical protein